MEVVIFHHYSNIDSNAGMEEEEKTGLLINLFMYNM